jgi:uncharacterized protein (TIGR02001 family)
MSNRTLLACFLLLLLPKAAQAGDWGFLYGYVDYASEYRFYGMSSSNRQPAVQGGLHWLAPDDFYAGVFGSQVRFHDGRNSDYELDFYGGRHFRFDGNDLNLEALYSTFPNTKAHPDYAPALRLPTYAFFETSAELDHAIGKLTLISKLSWSPAYGSHTGAMEGGGDGVSYAVRDWLTVSANAGHQWIARIPGRTHWDAGATLLLGPDYRRWSFDLRYYGTDISRADCYFTNWCATGFVAKVTYGMVL